MNRLATALKLINKITENFMLSNNKLQSSQDPWNNKQSEQLPDLEDLFRNLKKKDLSIYQTI